MKKKSKRLLDKAAARMAEDGALFYVFTEEEFKIFIETYKQEIKREGN